MTTCSVHDEPVTHASWSARRQLRRQQRRRRRRERHLTSGFTLLEVMVALAILAIALVGLIGRVARNARIAREMGMQDVATELLRSKMYDLEAELMKDGFPELNDELDGDFDEEGWPNIEWVATIEKVELPNLGTMGELDEAGENDDFGSGGLGGIPGTQGGGLMGEDGQMDAMGAGGMLGPYYDTLKEVLEVSIRKITVKVTWYVGQEDFDMEVSLYVTDPYGMYKVLPQGMF